MVIVVNVFKTYFIALILWQDQTPLSFLGEVFVFLSLLHMSLCQWW